MTETLDVKPPKVRKLRLADVQGATYNPRAITDVAFQGLRDSLTRFGLLEMPVVNTRGGKLVLISGHQRVQALRQDGVEFADCVVVNFDDTAERAANLSMNNPAIRGAFDPKLAVESLPDLAANLPRPDFAAFDTLIAELRDKAERASTAVGAPAAEGSSGAGGGARPSRPKSKVGKVYRLGKHRLFCGDFAVGLPALLKRTKAAACISDPPYNVAYESAAGDSIKNDDMDASEWRTFVRQVAKSVLSSTSGPSLLFMSSKEMPALTAAWEEAGGSVLRWLFWIKDRFTLGRGDYHHQHEPLLLGCSAGADLTLGSGLTSAIECPKPATNELHPTQKPVQLIRMLMEQVTKPGDIVIDPFAGSGTTLVVAEELGRRCFACELDPRFVDVIRKRWSEQAHGEDADWVTLTQ